MSGLCRSLMIWKCKCGVQPPFTFAFPTLANFLPFVIFCPIFIPLLGHFNVDPILFGTMVAVNLQAAFLSPPVAMSAFYLKGVAPKHVTLNQIFAGMMPYMLIVCLCLVFMYIWPGMTLWLPEFLYGK